MERENKVQLSSLFMWMLSHLWKHWIHYAHAMMPDKTCKSKIYDYQVLLKF